MKHYYTDEEKSTEKQVHIFHAGTKIADGALQTSGGRVLSVAARGTTLEDAVKRAYQGVAAVSFEGMFYRQDIASEALGIQPEEISTQEVLATRWNYMNNV